MPDLATFVALDPVFQLKGRHVEHALVINQDTHNALYNAYKSRQHKPHKLAVAILECQRLYDRKHRTNGYFTRSHFASSADYANYMQPLLVAQRQSQALKGHSLALWQATQKIKTLLQF